MNAEDTQNSAQENAQLRALVAINRQMRIDSDDRTAWAQAQMTTLEARVRELENLVLLYRPYESDTA